MEWPLERLVGVELRPSCRLLFPHLPRLQTDVVDLLLNKKNRRQPARSSTNR